MIFNIKEKTKGTNEVIVTNKLTAFNFESGLIDVFATPAMIGLMEKTAYTSIQNQLPKGFITLGIEINAKHIKATPIGMKVFCESKLIKVDGKKLIFEIKAYDEEGEIGYATHKRYIINSNEFMKRLKKD